MSTKTKYITEVLMCRPDCFDVTYTINPWMKPGSVNRKKAYAQWERLVTVLEQLDIIVSVIPQQPGLPDMVFAADQTLIKNNNAVISNFHYWQRQGESKWYINWLKQKNFNLHYLPLDYYFEGCGECVWYNDLLLVGTGFRNSPHVCSFLSRYLDIKTKCVELIDPHYYHLDTCFFALNGSTAFYYPPAFSPKSQKELKKIVENLIPLTKKEAENFAANSFATDHHVLYQAGNEKFAIQVETLGYKAVELDVSEFKKAGGGIHCLIQTIGEKWQ